MCLTLFVARVTKIKKKDPPMRFKKNNNNSYHVYSEYKSRAQTFFCKISFCPSEGNLEEQYQFEWKTEDEKIRRQIIREWKSKQKKMPVSHHSLRRKNRADLSFRRLSKSSALTNNVAISLLQWRRSKSSICPGYK